MSNAVSFPALERCIGIAAALTLCGEYGGTTVTVPVRPRETHPLVRLIGLEATRQLQREFGPARLDLPMGPTRGQRGRRLRAAQLLDKGWSAAEVARQADMHERSVWRVKARRDDVLPLLPGLGGAAQKD